MGMEIMGKTFFHRNSEKGKYATYTYCVFLL